VGELTIKFVDAFSVAALLLTIFLFVQLLFFKREKNNGEKYFLGFLGAIFVINVFFVIFNFRFSIAAATVLPFAIFSALIMSPLMWRQLKAMILPGSKVKLLIHFLPALLFGLVYLIFLYPAIFWLPKEAANANIDILEVVTVVFSFLFLIQNLLYLIMAFQLYKLHQRNIQESFSYAEKISLDWVKIYIIGYVIFIIGLVAVNLISGDLSNMINDIVFIAYLAYIGNKVFTQEAIYHDDSVNGKSNLSDKTSVSIINPDLAEELAEKLQNVMKEDQRFLDKNLSIFTLAQELGTNTTYLSQVVNQIDSSGFSGFVNAHRVEYAKSLLLSGKMDHLTMEAIGSESGFKSKSAFNAAFKKYTGKTPSTFQKEKLRVAS
jgi:AraC-like DNA-binding protein